MSWTAGGLEVDLVHEPAEALDAARPSGAMSPRRQSRQALAVVLEQAGEQDVASSTFAGKANNESTEQCRAGR